MLLMSETAFAIINWALIIGFLIVNGYVSIGMLKGTIDNHNVKKERK